jgi:multiple sugar transport system permease protein
VIRDVALSYSRAQTKRRVRISISAATINLLLLLGSIVMVFPFAWMVLSSFKSQAEILQSPPTFLPITWNPQSYLEAWNDAPFAQFYFNTALVAVVTTLSSLVFGALAGFGFAKHHFRGDRLFFICILTSMMIPAHVGLIPHLFIIKEVGLNDNLLALILPNLMTPFGAFLMTQYMQSIPDELIYAAQVDGASEIRIFWQIMLPLVRPALAALAIFRFMWSWNDFLWPVIVINSTYNMTLPIGLAFFQTNHNTRYDLLMAASTFVILPVLLVFFVMQKQFVAGITLTGLKA